MKILLGWVLNAFALVIVTFVIQGIQVDTFMAAMMAALVIGLVNMLIKPILLILTLPITIITLGLFIFVVNGLLFYAVGHFIQGFHVQNMTAGILGALVYSIISWVLTIALVPDKDE